MKPGPPSARDRVVEGDAVQAVTGRADFLVDLEAALQRGAVVSAERAVERPVHILAAACGIAHGRRPARASATAKAESAGRAGERSASIVLLTRPGAGDACLPSTDLAMVGKRPGRFDQADERHDQPEEGEIVERAEARDPDQRDRCAAETARRVGALRADIAEHEAVHDEDPEELLHQRPEARTSAPATYRARARRTASGSATGQHDDADQLLRHGAQHRVERQQVPFGHDVGRRHQRIGGRCNCPDCRRSPAR